jgi:hypothetical protein
VLEIVHEAREAAKRDPVAHRAQADAEHERLIWLEVIRRAQAALPDLQART